MALGQRIRALKDRKNLEWWRQGKNILEIGEKRYKIESENV